MEKLKLGVLGCSKIYSMRVAPALKMSNLIQPYAVASRNKEKGNMYAAANGFTKVYESYDVLLKDKDVDFVYIPLPNHLHFEYIKKAAEAGKHVLCEKPICLTAAQAKEAASCCEKNNVLLMEAFMYKFHPQWVRVKELALIGEIGNMLTVHTHFSYMNKDGNNIRNKADLGGGAIYDIGCYAISAARHLFGCEPVRVFCNMVRDPVFKTDIFVSGVLDFGDGRTSTFTISTQMQPFQRVTAVGATGTLSIEVPFNMFADVPGKITVRTGVGERVIESKIADQYLLEFDSFAKAVIDKTAAPTPIADAVANMAVIDAVYRAGASGGWEAV